MLKVWYMCRQGLLPQFWSFLALDSQHNNVHNLRVCQLLLESRALTPAELQRLGVVPKVHLTCPFSVWHVNSPNPHGEECKHVLGLICVRLCILNRVPESIRVFYT